MTREYVDSILRYMEHIREASYEADTKAEKTKLVRQYREMWGAIEPYIMGSLRYSDE